MFQQVTAKDGHSFDCWVVDADGDCQGGLVIIQEIFGVTDQLKALASTYAKGGFKVMVPALFDRVEAGTVVPFEQAPQGRDLMLRSDLELNIMDIQACVDQLAGEGHSVALMGFCWGGGLAIRCAQTVNARCAISFYGTRLPEYMHDPLKIPLQGHFGRTDDHVPPDMLDAFKHRYPEADVYVYEAGHAFSNEFRPSYVEEAATLAHERSLAFMKANLA